MNQYRRIVSYLYKYGNGKKGENTGFVRVETKEEGIRMHIHIRDLRMTDERRLKVYFYCHKENKLQLVFVDDFLCVRGQCEYRNKVYPDLTDSDFDKMNGVAIMDQGGLLYGSCWDENEIDRNLFSGSEEKEEAVIEEEEPDDKAEEVLKAQENILQGQEIMLQGADNIIRAVKIKLQDIANLPSSEWYLAENAFLKQAYETQEHLLLGNVLMPNGQTIWILGVPGNYNNREKYLAGIFGFSDYISEENREIKTGGKGYWIRQIAGIKQNR